jgi:hypothetical protein
VIDACAYAIAGMHRKPAAIRTRVANRAEYISSPCGLDMYEPGFGSNNEHLFGLFCPRILVARAAKSQQRLTDEKPRSKR